MVRKCLNGTAANNVDLGITDGFMEMNTWQGVCRSQYHSRCALEGGRHTQWNNRAIMEGRNDGGCGQRPKDFVKFGA